jgi:hypothetical protein
MRLLPDQASPMSASVSSTAPDLNNPTQLTILFIDSFARPAYLFGSPIPAAIAILHIAPNFCEITRRRTQLAVEPPILLAKRHSRL